MLPELKGIKASELVRALCRDGFVLRRTKGSHRQFRHPDGRRVTVASHKDSDTFPVGTLNVMLESTKWQEEDLIRLGLVSSRSVSPKVP